MRDFELLEPKSTKEASRMKADHGDQARLLAGGTALLLALRQRLVTPSHVVYLGNLKKLRGIKFNARSGLSIGALTRHMEVAQSDVIRKQCPVLADMAGRIANPQVRSQATLGGNLCYGDPASDPPTCLMALGASVVASGRNGERTIALEDFYPDYYQTALEPDEIVTEIRVPPLGGARAAYTRFLRTPAEHRPLVGLAVVGIVDGGVCRQARIAVGASTPVPTRVRKAEAFLEGKSLSLAVLEEAAEIAAAEITPLSDFRGSEDYRREMVKVVLRRTAASAFGVA